MGPESGLGCAGAVIGQLTGVFLKRFRITSDFDIKLFTVAGMCGAFSAIFPSPLLTLMLITELGVPLGNESWNGASPMHVLTLLATVSTTAYAVYYSLDTSTYLDAKSMIVIAYETRKVHAWDFAVGILFGIMGAILAVVYCLIGGVIQKLIGVIKKHLNTFLGQKLRILVLCSLGGIAYGALMYAFPLTVGSGSAMLGPVIHNAAESKLSVGLLLSSAAVKMVAYWICKESGLVGGLVFPMLLSGLLVGQVMAIWTGVNDSIAISCGFIALVTALVPAPFTFVLMAYFCMVVGQQGLVPIFACGFTSYLCCIGIGIPRALMRLSKSRKSRF